MIRALSREEIERLAERGRADYVGRPTASTQAANIGPSITLDQMEPLRFRGRTYKPRPVPYDDGLRLMEFASIVQQAALLVARGGTNPAAVFSLYRTAITQVMRIAHRQLRPRFVPRMVWALCLPISPVRGATLEEVKNLLSFFARCQMNFPNQSVV
jgi:hypothetical protein